MKKLLVSLCVLLLFFASIRPVHAVNPQNPGTLPEAPATEKAKPALQILSTETYRVYSQRENIIRFTLNNTSRFTANGVKIRPDITAEKSVPGVRILSTLLEPNNHNIPADGAKQYELRMVVDGTAKEGIYPITLDVTYKNNAGDPFQVSLLLYYEIRQDETKLEKVSIVDENFASVKPQADNNLTLSYRIKNDENYQIRNVKTRIEGLPAEFTLKSNAETLQIGDIMPLIAKEAVFEYYLRADIKAGSYPFTVVYEYDNQAGQRIARQEKYNIFIAPEETGENSGKLVYSGFSYPAAVAQDQSFNVSFKVTNNSDKEVKDVAVKLADNAVFLPKTPSIVKYDELKKGESRTFSVTVVGTGDGLKDRNYPMNFEISYKSGSSSESKVITDNQIIGVYVDAKDSDSEKDKEKNVPKIILDSYKIEPIIVQAGQEFDLEMVFRNTNQSKEIYNVKAFLTFDVATGKETVNQNVFSPVNSSNTFYINRIGANATVAKNLRMYVVPDAEPKSYTVTVNFEYEDKDGKQLTSKELVGIPVMQPTKVETSNLTVPTSVSQDQEFSVNFNIYNTGKAKAYNVMINAVGNFTADPSNQYIGNFDAGQSNSYEGYLRFSEPGEQSGKFVVTYDDQSGKSYTIEKEFKLMVEEQIQMPTDFDNMMPDDGMMDPSMNQPKGPSWLVIAGGILAVLVVIVLIIGFLRKRKHKKEMNSYEEK